MEKKDSDPGDETVVRLNGPSLTAAVQTPEGAHLFSVRNRVSYHGPKSMSA